MRLPVVDNTAWINRGNQPEKKTARGVRVDRSKRSTIGGRAIHLTAPGIHVVMSAPRQHKEGSFVAPLFVAPKQHKHATPPKPTMCFTCGEWFESRKVRGRHMADCRKEGAD